MAVAAPKAADLAPAANAAPATRQRASATWLAAGAMVLPVLVSPMGDRLYDMPKLVLLRAIALAGIGLLAGRAAAERRLPFRRQFGWPEAFAIVFLLFMAASTLASSNLGRSLWGSYERLQGLSTYACCVALFIAVAWTMRPGRGVRRVIDIAVFASIPVALLGLLEQIGLHLLPRYDGYIGRSVSTLGSPSGLGVYLAMVLPLALASWSNSRAGVARALLLGAMALDVAALALTLSREAWLGALAGVAVAAALMARGSWRTAARSRTGWLAAAAVGACVVALSAVLALSAAGSALADRVGHLFDAGSGTGAARLLIWRGGAGAAAGAPPVGGGPALAGVRPRQLCSGVRALLPD